MGKKKEATDELSEDKRHAILEEFKRKIHNVNSRHEKINDVLDSLQELSERSVAPKNKLKTKECYQNLQKTTESQIDYIKKMLADIERIRKSDNMTSMKSPMNRADLMKLINQQGHNLPLYCCTWDESHPPPFVGGIHVPDSIPLEQGDTAAAFTKDNWILAEVLSQTSSGKYEMHDIDNEQSSKFKVARKRLVPLPKWKADPEHDLHALFPIEAIVLALYPQTTCFYKGVVTKVPSNSNEDYQVAFEDSSYGSGYSPALPIPQRYVVSYKEVKSHKKMEED